MMKSGKGESSSGKDDEGFGSFSSQSSKVVLVPEKGDTDGVTESSSSRKRRESPLGLMALSDKIAISKFSATKCYVPQMLLEIITHSYKCEPQYEIKPASFFFEGVCMIVDISGFTRLSGQYCARGKSGIDELQKATNGFIGQLIEIVYHFRGDIIKFAGDAIICVFHDEAVETMAKKPSPETSSNLSQSDTPHAALMCALEVAKVETETLTVHVGISTGEICFSLLGGVNNRWECLIAGPCISEISRCLEEASSKQVVATKKFVEILGDHPDDVTCTALLSGDVLLTRNEGEFSQKLSFSIDRKMSLSDISRRLEILCEPLVVLDTVVHFLPLPIYRSLQHEVNVVAELREVTTMFMMWDSYSHHLHQDLLNLQPLFNVTQKILAKRGAFIRQFLVDDKGCVLIALWGVPSASYVDNAVRAMTAATEIRAALATHAFRTSYGITTGNVYCGTVGSAMRGEYSAIGDVVNLSARLMGKANGGVLIDEATFCRLPARLATKLAKPAAIAVKGMTGPVQIYAYMEPEVLEASDTDSTAESLVLRQAHIQILIKVLNAVAPLKLGLFKRQLSRSSSMIVTNQSTKSSPSIMKKGFSFANLFVTQEETQMAFVYVEGRSGSGKATLMRWFGKEAAARENVHVIRLTLRHADSMFDFRMLMLLFQELIGRVVIEDEEACREKLLEMLDSICQEKEEEKDANLRKHLISVMMLALGVTMDLRQKPSPIESAKIKSKRTRGGPLRISLSNLVFDTKLLTRKMSKEYINTILQRIFSYLLNCETCVVIIERLYNADEESLNSLATFSEIRSKSVVVTTSIPALDVEAMRTSEDTRHLLALFMSFNRLSLFYICLFIAPACTHLTLHTHTRNRPQFSSTLKKAFAPHLSKFRVAILNVPSTALVTVNLFTKGEIDAILQSYLANVQDTQALANIVHKFSGGSSFWVMEMIEFIKATGASEFEKVMNADYNPTQASPILNAVSGADSPEVSAIGKKGRGVERSLSFMRVDSPGPGTTGTNTSVTTLKRLNTKERDRRVGTAAHKSKLDAFVISRFENLLTSDDQMILKVASSVGFDFPLLILRGVLTPRLREKLDVSLQVLTKNHWVMDSTEGCFKFSHDFMRTTIYDLTPISERKQLHGVIAHCIKETYKQDPKYLVMLSEQYRHIDDASAFEYCCKAAVHMVRHDVMDGPACLTLLQQSTNYCETMIDVEVVLKILSMVTNTIHRHTEEQKRRQDNFLKGKTQDAPRRPPPQMGWAFCGVCGGGVSEVSPYEEKEFTGTSKPNFNTQAFEMMNRDLASLEIQLDDMRLSFVIDEKNKDDPPSERQWQEKLFASQKFRSMSRNGSSMYSSVGRVLGGSEKRSSGRVL